jgi:pimeloyl-ACP methyl ester carboxylesterase
LNTVVNGLNIYYELRGEGDYVFLLHGWGAKLLLYSKSAELMARRYTVVSVGLPGFNNSDEPKAPWGVSDYAEFFAAFVKQFNCEKVILFGHSFGGRVIIKTANMPNLPFTIEKIILTGSAGIRPKRTLKSKIRTRLYKCGKAVLSLSPIRKLFPEALENLRKKNGSADYNSASPMMRQVLVKTVNEDLTPLLPNIKAPTLLIWGENDTATPLSDGKLMESLIPGSGLVTIKNAGHYSFLDNPYLFGEVLKSFLHIS